MVFVGGSIPPLGPKIFKMTDEQFIFILKAKLKQYYLENKSVGMELKSLVAQFRQEIMDDVLKFKYDEKQIKKLIENEYNINEK